MYIETDFLQLCNLRNALQGKLIIGIEREFLNLQPALLFLHVVNLPVYLNQHGIVIKFPFIFFDNGKCTFLFRFCGRFIINQSSQ